MGGEFKKRLTASDIIILTEILRLAEKIKPTQKAKRKVLDKYGISGTPHDRFITGIYYEIMKSLGILDRVVGKLMDISIDKVIILDPWLRAALRVSVFFMLFEDNVSKNSDYRRYVSQLIKEKLSKFVSEVSHPYVGEYLKILVNKVRTFKYLPVSKEEHLEFKYKAPYWFINKVINLVGPKEAEELFKAFDEAPLISVRVNTLKASVQEVIEVLKSHTKDIKISKVVPTVLKFKGPYDFKKSRLFKEGKIIVQEEAAALASIILNPKPDDVVIDLCAAPGGKTTHLAELMGNKGIIYAFDISKRRIKELEHTVKRAGVTIVRTFLADGREAPDILGSNFADKVLVDAPCTSEGTIAKNQELRWRINEEEVKKLAKLQYELLETAIKVVKVGGQILYTTCALLKEENEDIVKEILRKNDNVEIIPLNGPYSEGYLKGTMRAWPHKHKTIGFFYALFKKTK